jgi:amidophosphoribosyltransferase
MSEQIKHECGIVLIRLLKPLEYYQQKYGTWMYGLNRLYLLMEKQHNRGQDGAGMVSLKLDVPPGKRYFHRVRSNDREPIQKVFANIRKEMAELERDNPEDFQDANWAKQNVPYASEIYMGHLRYGTFGRNNIEHVHPVVRENNWRSRSLVMAGNFNLTNVNEIFKNLVDIGQSPVDYSDTVTILENVGHFLDEENEYLFQKFKSKGYLKKEISPLISQALDFQKILHESSKRWDGGYAIVGVAGHGDAFVVRDPWGIRPAFYYADDEIVVVASERPVIQTVMNISYQSVKEIAPGSAIIIKRDGRVAEKSIRGPFERKSCSFERIYFSRGSDRDIYRERKMLGELLTPQILKSIDNDVENTVFSYIPNTAETAFYGMVNGVENHLKEDVKRELINLNQAGKLTPEKIDELISKKPRVEKVAIKDVKLRTFISQDDVRNDLAAHVYDVTYGIVRNYEDNLVIIDDSIVRGTTLKQSIIRILDRLKPKKIVIVSSSPQIRYPDCYGIDMAKLGDFIAFRAAIELLKDRALEPIIDDVYKKCKSQEFLPKEEIVNFVKEIYAPFTDDEISAKIAEMMVTPEINADVVIVYQTIDNLHIACPNDKGDWYFTGDYPTPGGNKVVNTSFINYIEKRNQRAY